MVQVVKNLSPLHSFPALSIPNSPQHLQGFKDFLKSFSAWIPTGGFAQKVIFATPTGLMAMRFLDPQLTLWAKVVSLASRAESAA